MPILVILGHDLKTISNSTGYSHGDGTATFKEWIAPFPEKTIYAGSFSNHPFALTTSFGTPQIFLKNTGIGTGFIHLAPSDGTKGNVGINLPSSSSPTFPLDVNGRIRLRNNGGNNTSGIWYDSSLGAVRVFMGMETDDLLVFYGTTGWSFRFNATNGNVGISTVPTSNKLEVNGTIGSSSLAGTGVRNVLADANGKLLPITTPQVWSINASAFTSITIGSAQFDKSLTSVSFSSGTSTMVAPVNLPTGVNITEITVFYRNSDPTNTLDVRLEALVLANNIIGGVNTTTVASKSLGTVTGIQSATLTIASGENLIDNTNRTYYLRISSNVWSNNMAIYGIKITYSY